MNIDQLRQQFPDENSCRQFFETARWPDGRICPHCGYNVSYLISGKGYASAIGNIRCETPQGLGTSPIHSNKCGARL